MDTIAAERNDLVFETRKRILAVLSPEQIGSIPGGSRDEKSNVERTKLPGTVPPGSVATPTGSAKAPPKFRGAPVEGGSKHDRIDPSSSGGDKSRGRGGGRSD